MSRGLLSLKLLLHQQTSKKFLTPEIQSVRNSSAGFTEKIPAVTSSFNHSEIIRTIIVADSDIVTEHNFTLPEIINVSHDNGGKIYSDYLFFEKITGTACIKLNGCEQEILKQEQIRADFISWIKNTQRVAWALCIPYRTENNELHAMYPDFLIVRRSEGEYIVDILEPRDSSTASLSI